MILSRCRFRVSRPTRLVLGALALTYSFLAPDAAVGQAPRDKPRQVSAANQDFRVGDQIVIYVRGDTALSNTFTVRDGVVLKLPNLPDISLAGVQRAEAEGRIRGVIATYLRDPEVRVSTLVRVGVLGQVVRPGYYQLASDALLSDALMAAGGPTPAANTDQTVVRNGGETLWDSGRVRDFLASGATLAQLNLHSGDEILVQERSRRDWATIASATAALSGVIVSVIYATRRH